MIVANTQSPPPRLISATTGTGGLLNGNIGNGTSTSITTTMLLPEGAKRDADIVKSFDNREKQHILFMNAEDTVKHRNPQEFKKINIAICLTSESRITC